MTRRSLQGLLALNGLLLLVLAAVTFTPSATAQQSRFRGNYTMVSGRAQGSTSYMLYIVNQTSRELVAIRYDTPKRVIEGMGYADLVKDAGLVTQVRK